MNELPKPSEVAEIALGAIQDALAEPFDALLCVVTVPTSEEYAEEAGVTL
jgi:hypothetical protein